jgi:hypothetical protein
VSTRTSDGTSLELCGVSSSSIGVSGLPLSANATQTSGVIGVSCVKRRPRTASDGG